jgi:hypothetical protein
MDFSARKTMRVTDSILDIGGKPQSAFANPEATAKLHVEIETIWSELEKLDRISQHRMALKQSLVTWKGRRCYIHGQTHCLISRVTLHLY